MKLKLTIATFVLIAIPIALAQPSVCDWRGYITVNGTLAAGTHVVTSYTNGSSATNGTIYSNGYYILHVSGVNNDNITFKVCGVLAYPTNESTTLWSCGGVGYNTLNLSMHTSADGSSCTYACGCSGGYCNSGSCASSPPTTTTTVTTTTTPSGGGGGGGIEPATTVAVTTVPVITTTLPPVEEIEIVESIEVGETGTFTYEEPGLGVTEISVEVKNAVSNAQITLTKTDTAPATVVIQAPGYTYMYLTVEKENIEDEDISRVTIKFKVRKSWISENNIDVSTIAMKRYSDGTWNDLPTTEVSEDATYVYFETESPGLSVFAVTGEKIVVTTTTLPIVTTTTVPVTPPAVRRVEWYHVLILFALVFLVLLVYKYGKKGK